MQKIGLLTFHASHNYGSMLQAYALYAVLNKMGYDVQIINFRSAPQKMMYAKPYKYWDLQAIRGRVLSPILFYKNIKKWNKFERFMTDNMPLTYEINHLSDIKQIINDNAYDIVITGSDQIWNMHSPDFNIGYLLPFKLDCKKIAYAPSMGHLKWLSPLDVDLLLKSLLEDYYAISVREKSLADSLSSILDKQIATTPDPTWLLDVEVYEKISYNKLLVKGKYLFYYTPRNEYIASDIVYEYAKLHNLKAVCSSSPSLACKRFINYNNAGPAEFLNLIKNAEIIIGNSMHMIIFALLFHKPFIVLSNDIDTRMKDLLKCFGLEDRFCSLETLNSAYEPCVIDWHEVDSKVMELKKLAITWLKNVIGEKY